MENLVSGTVKDLDMTLIKEKCKKGNINTRKCSKLWPKYPCYEEKMGKCFNADGDIFLEDPIDGVLYSLGEAYVHVSNSIKKLLNTLPEQKRLEKEEKLIRFVRDYGLSIFSLPDTNIVSGFKTIKDLDIGEYIDTAKGYVQSKYNKREGGGRIYDKIINPINGKKLSIHSKKGKELLRLYMNGLK